VRTLCVQYTVSMQSLTMILFGNKKVAENFEI